MNGIQQVYCTHCTHGSSALERREGELARRMLGYSARAGSLAAHQLRKYYRQIERYIYYYLPRDTPGEEKLRLTAATAPRRLIYFPSTSGLQLVGQICYRQVDTEGRPGSYFAHILFHEEKDGQPRWSQLDCLKLWGAGGWVDEDSPDIPFLLPSLSSLNEMLVGRRAAIDDGVFLSFLSTSADGAFDDPGGVIPPRWRQKDPHERSDLFTEAFRLFLDVTAGRRQSLLLVVEPGLAALLFYGIVRLLPGGIRDPISFSTFEPNTDRLTTTLAAVEFFDPGKTDLRPDVYRSRGSAINTFSDRRSESGRPPSQYAQTMVRRLLDEGFGAIDWRLESLQSVEARHPEDLDQLAAVDCLVPALFDPRGSGSVQDWPTSPMAVDYLRHVLRRRVFRLDNPQSLLEPLVGQPAHLLVLGLIAAVPEIPGTRAAVEYLVKSLPAERIADLLQLDGVAPEAKLDVLTRYVTAKAKLPPGCDHLWDERARTSRPGTPASVSLLPQLLGRLDPTTLERLYKNTAGRHSDEFVVALFEACKNTRPDWAPLTQIVGDMDNAAVLSLFRSRGPVFFKEYPQDEPAMAGKLHEILHSLPRQVQQFQERLDVVLAGEHLLPEDQDREIATAWAACRRAITDIGELQGQRLGVLRLRPVDRIESASRRMTEAITRALPPNIFDDDRTGTRKQKCLRQISQRLLGGKRLLPPSAWQYKAIWQKITWYFERGVWSRAPLSKLRVKSAPLKTVWLIAGGVGVAVVLVIAAMNLLGWLRSGRPTPLPTGSIAKPAHTLDRRQPPPDAADDADESEEGGTQEQAQAEMLQQQRSAAERAKALEAERQRAQEEARRQEKRRQAKAEATRVTENEARREAEMESTAQQEAQGREEAWRVRAEQFASEHAGAFLDRQPFLGGEVPIPGNFAGYSLGEGRLYLESGVYEFGAGFENAPPVSRQGIPQLAAQSGLKSVYVEIQNRPAGPHIVIGTQPKILPSEVATERREKLEAFEKAVNMIVAQLRIYRGRASSETEKNQAFDALTVLTGIEVPQVPPRPSRHSERFEGNAEAFEQAMREYNRAVSARSRALDSVIPTATSATPQLEAAAERIEAEYRWREDEVRRENEQAVAELKADCRQISAIVYRGSENQGSGRTSTTGEASRQPDAAAAEPKGTAPILGSKAAYGESVIKVERKPAVELNSPTIARVGAVVGAQGKPLPLWLRNDVLLNCVIVEQNQRGFVKPKELQDVTAPKTTLVLEGTSAVRIQFKFYHRFGDPFFPEYRLLAETPWHVIEPIEANSEYTIKLELGGKQMDQLRELTKKSGPG